MEQLLEQLKVNEDSLEEEKTRHLNTQDDLNKLQQVILVDVHLISNYSHCLLSGIE